MRWATSFRFTTTVAGRTWQDMPSTYSSCSTTDSASLRSSGAALLVMPRRSRTSPRRSVVWPRRMVSCIRDLESHLQDKEEALLSHLRCSSEHDQELLQHHVLLQTAEEAAKVKAREFEEFQITKDLEI
jgi:hypothetical protein